mmetsp:Transcript_19390/g.56278  ORF Transcript_19390/g.56278 Transcript_19390/m.56278 type:complete len:218 (-) Transcript_19390:1459-2112(-)
MPTSRALRRSWPGRSGCRGTPRCGGGSSRRPSSARAEAESCTQGAMSTQSLCRCRSARTVRNEPESRATEGSRCPAMKALTQAQVKAPWTTPSMGSSTADCLGWHAPKQRTRQAGSWAGGLACAGGSSRQRARAASLPVAPAGGCSWGAPPRPGTRQWQQSSMTVAWLPAGRRQSARATSASGRPVGGASACSSARATRQASHWPSPVGRCAPYPAK